MTRCWRCGRPLKSNANLMWVQHMVHHLDPFIDARKLERTQRELTYDDVARITGAYRAWRERLNAAIAENLRTIGFGSKVS